jgi:hypothetical protein
VITARASLFQLVQYSLQLLLGAGVFPDTPVLLQPQTLQLGMTRCYRLAATIPEKKFVPEPVWYDKP